MLPHQIRRQAVQALDNRRPAVAVARLAERLDGAVLDLHGHGQLTLLDAAGVRPLHVERFENFVAVPALDYLKALVRRSVSTYPTATTGDQASTAHTEAWTGTGADSDYLPGRTIGAVFLTDYAAPENSATETHLRGNIIGAGHPSNTSQLGNRAAHVPGSATRSPAGLVHRFEWGTTQANGTIGSVGWAADFWSSRSPIPGLFRVASSSGTGWLFPFPEHPALNDYSGGGPTARAVAVRQSDGLTLLIASITNVVQQFTVSPFTRSTDSAVVTGTSAYGTASASMVDMAIDGSSLWYTMSGSPYSIRRETLGALGTAVATFAKPWAAANPGLIAASPTHLYVTEIAVGASRTIYKLSQVDGSVVGSWTHDITARGGLADNAGLHSLVWDYTNSWLGVVDASGTASPGAANGATCMRAKVTWYDADGNFVAVGGLNGSEVFTSNSRWRSVDTATSWLHGAAERNGQLLLTVTDGGSNPTARLYQTANLGTRTRLGSPVAKTSANSLRCDYSFTYG